MWKTKFYIAAGIFLTLTALKLLLPAQIGAVRTAMLEQIDRSVDYKAAAATLGQKLEDYSARLDAVLAVPAPEETPERKSDVKPAASAVPSPAAAPEPPEAETAAESALLPFDYAAPLGVVAVSSGFGARIHPIDGVERFHYGLDLAAAEGESICAFADGEVVAAEYDDGYGNYIVLRHDDIYETVYAHCSQLLVGPGEHVTAGQRIALAGHTGAATGPHLHFELRESGTPIDPETFLC
jgi:murein DD-endopeptidase MepM/ murein hydrolase activator NlpD